jgi:NAD(P)-dependent dehydrogenase (short-subunit alcohol dehydrogenase family)
MCHRIQFSCGWSKMHKAALNGAVLVTGASSGIGWASARMLAARGLHVFAGVRAVESAHGILAGALGTITPVTLDLTSEDDTARVANELRDRLAGPGLMGLVNCGGIGLSGPLELLSREAIKRVFDVNVAGQLSMIQAVLPLLRNSGGRIVNVGSTSGRIPGALNGAYCASKFALEALTSVLRWHLPALEW